jgi:hypothetical protein
MKKKNILVLFIALVFMFMVYPMKMTLLSAGLVQEEHANNESMEQASQDPEEIVIRTYSLKFIRANEILTAAKFYIFDSTTSGDTIIVRIRRKNISEFEKLLKRLDVEKRTILFKVFTVIASREKEEQEDEPIENKGLKKVLDELRSLWNFKSYKIDGPSLMTVKEDSGSNHSRLVSSVSNFNMLIYHVKVKGEKPGERIITLGQIQLNWRPSLLNKESDQTLISTDSTTIKENGYLVAGISGFSAQGKGKALILIINAEIQ